MCPGRGRSGTGWAVVYAFGLLALLGTAVLGTAVPVLLPQLYPDMHDVRACVCACVCVGGGMRAHPCMHGEADGTRAVRLHA